MRGAARQLARIATGWRLRAVAEPLIVCTHAQTPEAILTVRAQGYMASPDLQAVSDGTAKPPAKASTANSAASR